MSARDGVIYFGTGLLFAAGLILSGMVNPEKVTNFLDFTGEWDPSLALVMGGAIAVNAATFRSILARPRPRWGDVFHIPSIRVIDARLVGGAALFGVGWGLGGYCPGPAIVSLGGLRSEVAVFTVAMGAGVLLHSAFRRATDTEARSTPESGDVPNAGV